MSDHEHRVVVDRLLGTRVTLRIRGIGDLVAAERLVLAEMERLEDLLSIFRPASEWCRWRRGEVAEPGHEIVELLRVAASWWVRGYGAFNPGVGLLRERWRRAVVEQVVPGRDEMNELAARIADLPYRIVDHRGAHTVERIADCAHLDLHALAKGWIVDRALDAIADSASLHGIDDVVLDAGGDLRHRILSPDAPTTPVTIGIEDPRRPFDNVPPLERVRFTNAAIASSSGARRPHRIAGRSFTHVLDPRTGWPIDHVLAATAVAPDAATADALATIVGVLPIDEGLSFVDTLERPHGASVLDASGRVHHSAHWPG